jgi:hypothetical protein
MEPLPEAADLSENKQREAEARPLAEPQEHNPEDAGDATGGQQSQGAGAGEAHGSRDDATLRGPSTSEHGPQEQVHATIMRRGLLRTVWMSRTELLPLDAVQLLSLRSRRVGHGQIDARGKLEP